KAGEKLGDRVELRLARAMYWAKSEKEGAAGELAKLLNDSNKFTLSEESQLLRGLAEAYLRVGKTEEAKKLWTQVAAKQPKDLRVRLFLSDLALQAGDDKALARLIDEIRQIEGEEGVYWRYAKATRIVAQARAGDRKGLADARALLAEAATLRPSWGAVPAREGEVCDLEGNQQLAVQKFRTAIELGERNPNIYRRAIQLLLAQGQPQEAGQFLTN